MTGAEFAELYAEMRDVGYSHEQIAGKLGVKRESLVRRIYRNGVEYIPEDHERPYILALDELIRSGREFDSIDVEAPFFHKGTPSAAIQRALHAGRIEVVRVINPSSNHPRSIYRGVAGDQAVAS